MIESKMILFLDLLELRNKSVSLDKVPMNHEGSPKVTSFAPKPLRIASGSLMSH